MNEEKVINEPLSEESFLPLGGYLAPQNAFQLLLPLCPCRKVYGSFFWQLCCQVSKIIEKKTGTKARKDLYMCINARFKSKSIYDGGAYQTIKTVYGKRFEEYWYSDTMVKLHCDGYSYAEVGFVGRPHSRTLGGDLWIRWKSLRPEYEYIDYDSGLELTEKDISFEICTKLPDSIRKEAEGHYPYRSAIFQVDCNAWKETAENFV